jgi:hypothetical protein
MAIFRIFLKGKKEGNKQHGGSKKYFGSIKATL